MRCFRRFDYVKHKFATALVLLVFAVLALLAVLPVNSGLSTSSGRSFLALPAAFEPFVSTEKDAPDTVLFLNDRARDITGATAVNAPGFVVPGGLTGEGQIVAIADSGLDAGNINDLHPDLQSTPGKMPKVVLLKSWAGRDKPDDPNGHGTHMAATVAGTGAASDGKFRGMAPGASIYFQAILNKDGEPELPQDLEDLFWPAYSAGARVHIDGWGSGANVYGESATQVDDFVRAYPDFLAIFGAGNSGPFSGTITAEANSKNALAVGASVLPRPAFVPGAVDTSLTAGFSSRGPAGDGRIKPELLAPASAVISARSSLVESNLPGYPEYTRMQGTSMAAAVAGGSAALLREYFKKYLNIPVPSAALIKAALINGSRQTAGGPSKEGFGIIDLAGTVIALQDRTFGLADETAGISQGGEANYTFQVTDSAAPFKATLAWTDPPAQTGSGQTLVNNLDLIVQTPDGRVYYGNHFLGNNAPDSTNNIEQIYLSSPVPGNYVVQVKGAAMRRNVVSESAAAAQDYALVWGQTPEQRMVDHADERQVTLTGGASFDPRDVPVVNLINDSITEVDTGHIFPGSAVLRTPQRVYIAVRLWRATGVKALNTADGTVLTEINPVSRVGGYMITPDSGRLLINGKPAGPGDLPAGVEIGAVVNPVDQKIKQARTAYTEREGVVSAVNVENGQKTLYLAGGRGTFRISSGAAYSYEDSYTSTGAADMPFGTGAIDELEELMPGMPVRLHIAPSSGEAQYLAVKRRVALGTVSETKTSIGEIKLENGAAYRLFPGAPVKRDRENAGFDKIMPGDHVAAVLLPDTGEVIGMVAYSSVLYGKAVDFTRKDRTLYLIDDHGRYRSFYLPADAVIYRWGVKATADAIAAGARIRVTTDPGGQEVWRLDLAETFYENNVFECYDGNTSQVTTREGGQYRVTTATRLYKNGYPVWPGDLLSGEKIDLEYAVTPPPGGNVLFSVNARSNVAPTVLFVSVVPLRDRFMVTGRIGANAAVYMWEGNSGQAVPVDESGRFSFSLPVGNDGKLGDFTLVAVDRRTGSVAGRPVAGSGYRRSGRDNNDISKIVAGIMSGVERDTVPDGVIAGDWSGTPLTRAQVTLALARLLNWPGASEWPLTFNDLDDFPLPLRPAVAEANARGIFRGYPNGRFLPREILSRAQAAVVIAAVLNDLGLEVKQTIKVPYADAADIPTWAAKAVIETTAAGLFCGRPDGVFAPGDPVTAGEMGILLERLLAICEYLMANDLYLQI